VSTDVERQVEEYWERYLDLPRRLLRRRGLLIHESGHRWLRTRIVLFEHSLTSVIVAPRARGESVASLLEDLTPGRLIEALESPLRTAYSAQQLGPIYFEGFFSSAALRPQDTSHVRALTAADGGMLSAFIDACPGSDWRDSGIESDGRLHAVVIEGVLASVSQCIPSHGAGSVGVVTLPAHRGRGFAKAAMYAAIREAHDRGQLVVCQTPIDNRPSLAAMQALGVSPFARMRTIHPA